MKNLAKVLFAICLLSLSACGKTTSSTPTNPTSSAAPAVSVNTNVPVESVALSQPTATLWTGKSVTLTPTILPANATDKTLTWSSSNSSVADVNEGVVYFNAIGSTTITAASSNGKKAICRVSCVNLLTCTTSLPQSFAHYRASTLWGTINITSFTYEAFGNSLSITLAGTVTQSYNNGDGECYLQVDIRNSSGNIIKTTYWFTSGTNPVGTYISRVIPGSPISFSDSDAPMTASLSAYNNR
jgi:hypothetical protein